MKLRETDIQNGWFKELSHGRFKWRMEVVEASERNAVALHVTITKNSGIYSLRSIFKTHSFEAFRTKYICFIWRPSGQRAVNNVRLPYQKQSIHIL